MKFRDYLKEQLGVHVIKNPAGSYNFVGSIPAEFAYEKTGGNDLTKAEYEKIAKSSNPSMMMKQMSVKSRIFKSSKLAVDFAKKHGVKITSVEK